MGTIDPLVSDYSNSFKAKVMNNRESSLQESRKRVLDTYAPKNSYPVKPKDMQLLGRKVSKGADKASNRSRSRGDRRSQLCHSLNSGQSSRKKSGSNHPDYPDQVYRAHTTQKQNGNKHNKPDLSEYNTITHESADHQSLGSLDKKSSAYLRMIGLKNDFSKAAKSQADTEVQRSYSKNIQKLTLCRKIRDILRHELQNMYRNSEYAYSSMDFSGKGFITEQDFLGSKIVQKLPFSNQEVVLFFKEYNLFSQDGGLQFDNFKKNFFPHHYMVQDEADDADDRAAMANKKELLKNKANQPQVIEERLIKLEQKLKIKFSNCFESVRKAFLTLDQDYDGFITVEDILKYFGNEKDLNYNDLKKLMMDKDHKKRGKIGYKDFSKWLGNSIHMSEGFYFRHDSVKNPQYERFLDTQKETKQDDLEQAQKNLLTGDIEAKILEKIKFQWKTLRKAFMDLNMGKSGAISKKEFKYYLKFWGLDVTDEVFDQIYKKYDLDGDGAIGYKDFQLSIGMEMFPMEGLYFRQDKKAQQKIISCQHDGCWQPTSSNKNYCLLHQKMHQDETIQIFTKMFNKLGKQWKKFVESLKQAANPDDQSEISFKKFTEILKQNGLSLTSDEKRQIQQSMPGKEQDSSRGQMINIARIYDQKYNIIYDRMYNRVDISDFEPADEPRDINGYLGLTKFYRKKVSNVQQISEDEFIFMIHSDNKLDGVMMTIKQIDKDHNGYVTRTELDDILKLFYKQLESMDLIPIIKRFGSIQNKILIDYKAFKEWIQSKLGTIHQNPLYNKNQKHKQDLERSKSQNLFLKQKIHNIEKKMAMLNQNEKRLSQKIRDHGDYREDNSRAKSVISGGSRRNISRSQSRQVYLTQKQNPRKLRINGAEQSQPSQGSSVGSQKSGQRSERPSTTSNIVSGSFRPLHRALRANAPKSSQRTGRSYSRSKSAARSSSRPRQADYDQTLMDALDNIRDNQPSANTAGEAHQRIMKKYLEKYNSSQALTLAENLKRNLPNNTSSQKGLRLQKTPQQDKEKYQDSVFSRTIKPTNDHTMKRIMDFTMNLDKAIQPRNLSEKYKTIEPKKGPYAETEIAEDRGRHDIGAYRDFMFEATEEEERDNSIDSAQEQQYEYEIDPTGNNDQFNTLFQQKKSREEDCLKNAQKLTQVMSQQNQDHFNEVSQHPSQKSAASAQFKPKFEKIAYHKLAYEWKNIYRWLTQIDDEGRGVVVLRDFDKICERVKVSFTKQESKNLVKFFGFSTVHDTITEANFDPRAASNFINFKKLSLDLGLHKESLNYINQVHQITQIKNRNKLRQLYRSIDEPAKDHRFATYSAEKQRIDLQNKIRAKCDEPVQISKYLQSESHFNPRIKNSISKQNSTLISNYKTSQNFFDNGNCMLVKSSSIKAKPIARLQPENNLTEEPQVVKGGNTIDARTLNSSMRSIEKFRINLKDKGEGSRQILTQMKSLSHLKQNKSSGPFVPKNYFNDNLVRARHHGGRSSSKEAHSTATETVPHSLGQIPRNMDDTDISKHLQIPHNLAKFREVVIMQMNKNDVSTNLLQEQSDQQLLLPVSSFKQCLQSIGLSIGADQLRRFVIRGEIITRESGPKSQVAGQVSPFNDVKANPMCGLRYANSSQSTIRPRLKFNQQGSRQLGVDVQKFLRFYI